MGETGGGVDGRRWCDHNCGEKYKIHVKARVAYIVTVVCGAQPHS